ncbi:EamA family transporter [Nocardioides sp.]|uniref:EamA family transporter n=1 Tax=Nocardioides sp. TaxID=35761 RepID=UPI002ED5829A
MATLTHDTPGVAAVRSGRVGLGFAVLSAMSFGLSGTLAKGLLEAGWTPGAAVTARIALAALVLLVPGLVALRGRWHLLREHGRFVVVYGLVGVAVPQLAFFSAIERMQVGVALLIEFTAPAAVVMWLWLRHSQRPGALTAVGGITAGLGLVLVLDLVSGADLDPVGVAWALVAMAGCATYFVMSGSAGSRLPPVVLAASGVVVGGAALLVAGAVGALDMTWATDPASFRGVEVPWWLPVAGLAVVTCSLAYLFGIVGIRALGSRVASFVALLEVLFGLLFAWLLLGELPRAIQVAGGVAIVAGVVLVKLGEPRAR